MMMPNRKFSASSLYRYGFNGKEKDNEVSGDGNQYDYGFRIYDPRIVRFKSVDPLTKKYPELTPYQFASNRPIDGIDLDGKEWSRNVTIDVKNNTITTEYTVRVKVVNNTLHHNNASYTNTVINGIKNQVESSYSGTDKFGPINFVYKTKFEYTVVNQSDIDDQKDFYVSINNRINTASYGSVLKGEVREIGNTNKNKIDVTGEHNGLALSLTGIYTSGAHEIGHTGGLIHPKTYTGIYYLKYKLGYYDGNLMNQGVDGNQGTDINLNQLQKIAKTIANNNPPTIFKLPTKTDGNTGVNHPPTVIPNPNNTTTVKQ